MKRFRDPSRSSGARRRSFAAAAAVCLLAVGLLIGCAANEPFEPDKVPNQAPTLEFFVSAIDSGGDLNPTSYFRRTFSWNGSDRDGWIDAYFVSISTEAGVTAPWDTTTRTDTTLTIATDADGLTQTVFRLVCRDNRGALSDTVVQTVPVRNFPPEINFQRDFEPQYNFQREIVYDGTAAIDTVFWNWGASNFRLSVIDVDGRDAMDNFYRYTLMDEEPTQTWEEGDPAADPDLGWIRAPLIGTSEIREFEIRVKGVAPGSRTLTVSAADEAGADTRFTVDFEVRSPRSPVLFIPDNASTLAKPLYTDLLDQMYGPGNWDTYVFWGKYPDAHFVVVEAMRAFEAVIWTTGTQVSTALKEASATGGALAQYLTGSATAPAGRLLMVSPILSGTLTTMPQAFTKDQLHLAIQTDPVSTINLAVGKSALSPQPALPAMMGASTTGKGLGLVLPDTTGGLTPSEIIYQLEYCPRCYSLRPTYTPIIGVRWPERTFSPLARVASFSVQLEYMVREDAVAALEAVLTQEMGVSVP